MLSLTPSHSVHRVSVESVLNLGWFPVHLIWCELSYLNEQSVSRSTTRAEVVLHYISSHSVNTGAEFELSF